MSIEKRGESVRIQYLHELQSFKKIVDGWCLTTPILCHSDGKSLVSWDCRTVVNENFLLQIHKILRLFFTVGPQVCKKKHVCNYGFADLIAEMSSSEKQFRVVTTTDSLFYDYGTFVVCYGCTQH